jgi:hypothetical protein
MNKKKIISISLFITATLTFWISLGIKMVSASCDYYEEKIGIPVYVIKPDADGPYFPVLHNIIIMSIILSSLLFLSGYYWAKSTNKNSNQKLEPTVKTPVE